MYLLERGRTYLLRLAPGSDLYEGVSDAVSALGLAAGLITGIGALRKAALGIFVADKGEYNTIHIDRELEICALTGNVSVKDDKPFVHFHLTVSDRDGNAFGGHCLPGCEVFVCELAITELIGDAPVREPRPECGGLALWRGG